MPRPMLRQPQTQTQTNNILSATQQTVEKKQTAQMDKMMLDRLLRKPRSKAYMEAVHKLDAGGHVHNHDQVSQIINTLREEFPEVELNGILLGFVAVCYLGKPYEVHTLDLTGQIIKHYTESETLPGGLEKARSLALHGGYAFIEVYVDCCRCISHSGAVSVVTC